MQISVKTLMDKTITPEVQPSVTMQEVKVEIQDTGHPASPTELTSADRQLRGPSSLRL